MNPQAFNDGIANIYSVENIALPGGKPKERLILKMGSIRYKERTVGMSRYWTAMQTHARIDLMLRMPQLRNVTVHDIIIPVDGEQYRIVQVQYPEDVVPAVMDLSLQRLDASYDITV